MDVRSGKNDAGLEAEFGGADDLDLLAGVAGKIEPGGVVLRLGEAQLIEVKELGGGGILDGERDDGHLVADTGGAEACCGPGMVKSMLPAPALCTAVGESPWAT